MAELLLANVASKRFLLGVRSFVNDEIGFAREIAPALRALKWSGARMKATMYFEILQQAEGSWACVTPERREMGAKRDICIILTFRILRTKEKEPRRQRQRHTYRDKDIHTETKTYLQRQTHTATRRHRGKGTHRNTHSQTRTHTHSLERFFSGMSSLMID